MDNQANYIPTGYAQFVARFLWKLDRVFKSIHRTDNLTITLLLLEPLDTITKNLISQVFFDWKEQFLETNTEIKDLCINYYETIPNIPTLAVEIGIGVYCKEDESENGESING